MAAIIRDFERDKRSKGMILTGKQKQGELGPEADDADISDEDDLIAELPSYLKEESSDEEEQALYSKKAKSGKHDDVTGYRARSWLPVNGRGALTKREILEQRDREIKAREGVRDGTLTFFMFFMFYVFYVSIGSPDLILPYSTITPVSHTTLP